MVSDWHYLQIQIFFFTNTPPSTHPQYFVLIDFSLGASPHGTCVKVVLSWWYTLFRTETQTRKEGNVLFNDALNTFYLWLFGVVHIVKDHSDSERGNPLLPHGLPFQTSRKGSLYAPYQTGQHIPQCLVLQSWSTGWKREIAHWVHHNTA